MKKVCLICESGYEQQKNQLIADLSSQYEITDAGVIETTDLDGIYAQLGCVSSFLNDTNKAVVVMLSKDGNTLQIYANKYPHISAMPLMSSMMLDENEMSKFSVNACDVSLRAFPNPFEIVQKFLFIMGRK